MSPYTEAPERVFAKLGFSHLETAEIVNALNNLLINYQIHYQKLRNFHWNVEGPDFFELHAKFEELYNEVKVNIDDVAERIRVFGKYPVSTMREYVEKAEISEITDSFTGYQMVREVLNDFEILLSFMLDANNAATRIGDTGTADMITKFIVSMEKHHWMLTSWLKGTER